MPVLNHMMGPAVHAMAAMAAGAANWGIHVAPLLPSFCLVLIGTHGRSKFHSCAVVTSHAAAHGAFPPFLGLPGLFQGARFAFLMPDKLEWTGPVS
jgi:hypothetical protein